MYTAKREPKEKGEASHYPLRPEFAQLCVQVRRNPQFA